MKREPPLVFQWLDELPTTGLAVIVTQAVIVTTTVRYLFGPPIADFGQWLAFCGSLTTILGAVVVGKRWTSDPDVITAEAAARQDPPPRVVSTAEGMSVTPAVGASNTAAEP